MVSLPVDTKVRKIHCLNCKFGVKSDDMQEALMNPDQRICRQGPPSATILPQGMVTGFPRVTKKDYCFKHMPAIVLAGSQDTGA